jgi:hypothetical protein
MSDIPDAIGSLVEGGMLARAVEPSAGEARDGHTHEQACLNCGTALIGPHCHACGQHAHVHRTVGAFFHDLLHGVFHFEGKTWRTLPLLAWNPGKLTREYIDGRRASYVSPIALFLFATFLAFAVFHAIGEPIDFGNVSVNGQKQSAAAAEAQLSAQLNELRAQRRAALAAHEPTVEVDNQIAGIESALGTVRALKSGDLKTVTSKIAKPSSADGKIDRLWKAAKANPDLLIYKLQSNAYKYSWLLIPISVPFVWLLFAWRRRYGLYDHTVFVTYSLSFMLLALTIASLGAAYEFAPLVMAPVLYAPFHMYRQLRGAYALGRGGALVRTVLLLWFAAIALTLWALALLALLLES